MITPTASFEFRGAAKARAPSGARAAQLELELGVGGGNPCHFPRARGESPIGCSLVAQADLGHFVEISAERKHHRFKQIRGK